MRNALTVIGYLFLIPFSTLAESPRLVVDQDYFPALMEELDKGATEIDILAFSFAIDNGKGSLSTKSLPYRVASKIKFLSEHGTKVRLYIEGQRDTSARNRIAAEFLAASGVEVHYGATHAKGFRIDQRVLFGSTNLTQQSMAKNNETNLLIADEQAAREFKRYFEHLWAGGKHGELELNRPMIADGRFKTELLDMINRADKRIEFSIYYFHDREIEAALISAYRRGVHIRGYLNQHDSFGLELVKRNRETVRRLQEAGLDDLHFDLPSFFSHSKYLIRDDEELALGTGNWNRSDVEQHPQLYIRLYNPGLAQQLSQHLAEQISTESAD